MEHGHKVTLDHNEIRTWAERNNGKPQLLDDPSAGADRPAIRIDFPGPGDEVFLAEASHARDIEWTEFFDVFEHLKLLFVYQPVSDDQDKSNSYRFEPRTSQ
jgi:hypothetical protein